MKQQTSFNIWFYSSVFMVTQITGLLLSLVICFILKDFTWEFVRMALVNSFILGLALIGTCYLTQKLMFGIKTFYITAISFSLVLGISITSFFITFFLFPTLFIYYDRGAFSFLFINFLFILGLWSISSGLIIYREIMVDKEKTIGNERDLKNQMEMKLLTARINPHFLFNTLNTILTLLKQPEKAETAILNLSDLLRENLEQSDKTRISIEHELDNVNKYLELQKMRFGEKLHYEIINNASFFIPPIIIQPLVENCIKHNMQHVSRLSITIVVDKINDRNIIFVTDSEKAVQPSMLDKGQGLTITKKRVESNNGLFMIKQGGIEISFTI